MFYALYNLKKVRIKFTLLSRRTYTSNRWEKRKLMVRIDPSRPRFIPRLEVVVPGSGEQALPSPEASCQGPRIAVGFVFVHPANCLREAELKKRGT